MYNFTNNRNSKTRTSNGVKKQFYLFLILVLGITGIYLILKTSPQAANFLWQISQGGTKLLPLIIVSAAIDSINPCAFSILLLTIGFLFGLGRLRSDILRLGSAYIAGIFFAYLAIGLGILGTLHLFSTPHFVARFGAWLMIILGLIGLIQIAFPKIPLNFSILPHVSRRTMASLMEKGSVPAIFILGGIVGLCEFPCTGGPYLAVLGLLRVKETMFSGLGYLLIYNLVFILPLVLILGFATQKVVAEKISRWQKEEAKNLRLVIGGAMIVLGFIILKFFI